MMHWKESEKRNISTGGRISTATARLTKMTQKWQVWQNEKIFGEKYFSKRAVDTMLCGKIKLVHHALEARNNKDVPISQSLFHG